MQRPLLCRAGFALGLFLSIPPLFGQLPAGSETPAETPAGQTVPAGNAPPDSVAPATGSQPVPGGPLGQFAPGAGNGAAAEGNGSTAAEEPGAAGPISGPQLPEGYQPPSSAPAIITKMPDPRRTDEEMKAAEQELRRAGSRGIDAILYAGDLSEENKEWIAKWAQLQADRLAAADSVQEISEVGAYISQKMRTAASQQGNTNRQRDFRQAVAEALTKELRDVLLNNSLYVRIQAAALLGDINLMEPPVQGNEPPESYTPAIAALLDAIEDSEGDPQADKALQAVKIAAAVGIRRLAKDSTTMDVDLRYRAADVMTKALGDPKTHFWYQKVLAEALASLELDVDRARNPIVVTALLSVISDSERPCGARAAAAKALSRTPIVTAKFDADAAAAEILAMGREFSLEYNKNPKQWKWRYCFHDLSLAFQLDPDEESAQLPENCLLRQATLPAPYQTVQQRLQPVVDFVLSQGPNPADPKPIPNDLLQPLSQPLPGAAAAVATE